LRVLLTNRSLENRAGSELYLFELATRLLARGHSPIAFSPRLGPLAASLRQATIPVVDNLAAIGEPPDLIHGQHHLAAMMALLHFPGVPALFLCHGWQPWEESPPLFPRIHRYVAVDFTTRERLVSEAGIAPDRVEVVLNFVDLERFQPRPPLPAKPLRALVFSNQASEGTFLPAVREACARFGIALDVAGVASGNTLERPEERLALYDLVFAKGRAAIEGMAVGAAVVLCDQAGSGPLVTAAELDGLRRLNFGIRTLRHPVTPDVLADQIQRYDPADAAEVSRRLRATAGIDDAVDRLLALYQTVLAEHRRAGNPPPADESRAASAYLRWLNPAFDEREQLLAERTVRNAETSRLLGESDRLRAGSDQLRAEALQLLAERDRLNTEAAHLRSDLQAYRSTATWRLRERLLRYPLLRRGYRWLRGAGGV
jgi:hypothetical protein